MHTQLAFRRPWSLLQSAGRPRPRENGISRFGAYLKDRVRKLKRYRSETRSERLKGVEGHYALGARCAA